MKTAGYSGKQLYEKLGVKSGFTIMTVAAPDDYEELLGDLPADVVIKAKSSKDADMVHVFATAHKDLAKQLPKLMKTIRKDGMIWVSWPKKSAKVETDLTEDVIRNIALAIGLVDVKVCAVSDVWSGLKLVIRKENR